MDEIERQMGDMLEAEKVEEGSVDGSNQNTHMHKFFKKEN